MTNKMVLSVVLDADEKGLISGLKVGQTELKEFGNESEKAGKKNKDFSKETGGAAKAVTALKGVLATVGFGVLAADMFKSISSTQKLQAQLKTITGSYKTAGQELDRLIGFAKQTPFTIDQSVEAFAKLTHLGLNPSEEAMMSYGNTASAMGKDMMQMVEAVADASVGEFERLKEFGIKAKQQGDKVSFTFQGVTTTVGKNSQEIQKYLLDVGNTKFAGAMTDQMDTLGAKASNLGVAMTVLYRNIGETGLADKAGNAIDYLADGVDTLSGNLPAVLDKMETFASFFLAGAAIRYAPVLFNLMKVKAIEYSVAAKTAAASTSAIGKAQGALMALYAGWEIGSYLNDEFVEARVAGLAFVGAMETGFVNLQYAGAVVTAAISHAWDTSINFILDGFADLLGFIASGAELLGMDEYAAQLKKMSDGIDTGTESSKTFEDQMITLNDERDQAINKIDDTIVSLINHEYAQEKAKNQTEKASEATQENTKVTEENTEASEVSAEAIKDNDAAVKSLISELSAADDKTKEYTDKQKLLVQAHLDGKLTAEELSVTMAQLNEKYGKQSEVTAAAAAGADEYAKSWEKAVERVDEAFSDGWLDLLQGKSTSVFDTIKSGFERMLAEMLHMALTKPIMLNIQQGVSSMIPGMGSAGGLGSMLSGGGGGFLNTAGSLLSNGIGGSVIGMGTGIAQLGAMTGIGGLGSMGAGFASTGAAFAGGGLGAVGSNIGAMFSGGGMMAGIGSIMPVIGMVAGLASLADSLSGGGLFGTSYKTYDNGVNLEYDGGGFSGEEYTKKKKKKSLFRGTKRKTVTSDLDDGVVAGMNNYFDGVENLIASAAQALNVDSVSKTNYSYEYEPEAGMRGGNNYEVIETTVTETLDEYMNNFKAATSLSLKDLSDEEASQAIAEWTQNTANSMIGGVFGPMLDEMAIQGETLTQTLTRVVQQLAITTSAFDSINLSLTDLSSIAGISAAQYADEVTAAAGGSDRLMALVQNYQAAFFTQEELLQTQLTNAAAQMHQALDLVGADQAGFREQFESASSEGLAADQIVQWLEAGNLVGQVEAIMEQLTSIAGEEAAAMISEALVNGEALSENLETETVAAETDRVAEATEAQTEATIQATMEATEAQTEATIQATNTQTEALTTVMKEQQQAIQDLNETSSGQHKEQISALGKIAGLLAENFNELKQQASAPPPTIDMSSVVDAIKEATTKPSWETPPVIKPGIAAQL